MMGAPWAFDPEAVRGQWLQAGSTSWLSIVYLGSTTTIVGYSLWTGLLKRHRANRVLPFGLGMPIVGLAASMLVLGEVITPWQWGGIALVEALVEALVCVLFGSRLRFAKAG